MHTFLARLNQTSSTLSFAVGILVVALGVIAWAQLAVSGMYGLSSRVANIDPQLALRTARRAGSLSGRPKENVRVSFDLDADLTPLFNWNTKQVFVYLAAEYGGARDDIDNEVVLWDQIITDKANADLHLKNVRGKYNVWDIADSFEGRTANVTLRWNIQPHVGFLLNGESPVAGPESSFVFPKPDTEPPAKSGKDSKRKPRAAA